MVDSPPVPSLDHVLLQVPGSEEGSVTDIAGKLLLPPVIVLLLQGDLQLEGLLEGGVFLSQGDLEGHLEGAAGILPQGDLHPEGLVEGGGAAG